MKRIAPLLLALLALSAPAAQTGHAVYRPGLTQARIPLGSPWGYKNTSSYIPNLSSNLLDLANEGHADWLDRTLDVFKDGEHKKNGETDGDPNPLSGKSWPWSEAINNDRGVFAYEGEMFVEAGTNYYFFGRMYTGEALVVDGATVVWQGENNSWNVAPAIYGSWTAPKTGWVPFNAWLWTWSTVNSPGDPQWSEWGLQYNVAGFSLDGLTGSDTESGIRTYALYSYTNAWRRFVDPGNGSFLRTVVATNFTTVGEFSLAQDGSSATFALSFADVPTNANLVAFTGPVDGFHDSNNWVHVSDVLPSGVPVGNSTANVTVPLSADARVLRFRLAHFNVASTDGKEVFEEWTELFPVSTNPVVCVDAVSPSYMDVSVSGMLESIGFGGTEATVTVEVAPADDADFLHVVSSETLTAVSAAGPFGVVLSGLATNTTYHVRAMASNDLHAVVCSVPVEFHTLSPGLPKVSVAATVCTRFSADLRATVSDWGDGSWDAEAWIDVSSDESFPEGVETQTLPLGTLSGEVPRSAKATATGLAVGHDYFARVRAVNSLGLEAVSETISFSTSHQPIGFPAHATVIPAAGRVTATLAPTFVTPGTVYDVELTIEGVTGSRKWSNQTGYGPFSHTQNTAVGNSVVFVYTITWTYDDQSGTTLSGTIVVTGVPAAAQLADIMLDKLPMIDPDYDSEKDDEYDHTKDPYHGVYLRVGQTAGITPSPHTRIDWHTNAVLTVTETNGVFVVEALEPGAALLYETDLMTGKTNNVIGAAIVLPTNNPAGGIYVHRKLENFNWDDPKKWEMVAPGPQGYPDAPGALAYVVSPASYGYHDPDFWKIEVPREITLGGLVVGQLGWIHHGGRNPWAACYWLFNDKEEDEGKLVFDSGTPDKPSWIRVAGNSYTTSFIQINVPLSMENDFEIDEMNRIPDICPPSGTANVNSSRERGLYFKRLVDVGPYMLRTVRTHSFPYIYGSGGSGLEARGWISFRNDIRGTGTIRLEAATQVGLLGTEGRVKSFSGIWDVANGDLNPKVNSNYGAASLNLSGASLGHAKEMIIRGSWHRALKTWPRGAIVRTGCSPVRDVSAWTNDWQDALPTTITLDGGHLQLFPQAAIVGRNRFRFDRFIIPVGPMGRLEAKMKDDKTWPHVLTEITNLVLSGDTVVSFDYDKTTTNESNEFYIVNEPAGWIPSSEATAQFLPFFFANNQREGTGGNTIEGMEVKTQDNTRLAFRDIATGKVTLEDPETTGNGYRRWIKASEDKTLVNGTSYYAMLLAQNVTNEFAAGGAVVSNLAGYLDMRGGSVLGTPTNAVSATCTLDFGDQPARLFNGHWGETNVIGCKLAGSAGLVKGGNGVTVLAASADGIEGGVRVAGGTLVVGLSKNLPGRIGGDVRVEAGSRLVLSDTGSIAPKSKLFLNDRDWIPSYAHVRLEDGVKAIAKEILVDGEELPHGWYGPSDSLFPVNFVDDVHFEGTGRIHAGNFPTMMILR